MTLAPGVYDMPDAEYHGIKDALSCSGAQRLLDPSCPALFKYELEHQRPPKDAWDLGHAVHQQVLGEGPEIVVIDHDSWRSKDSQERKAAAYAEGKVPLLTKDYEPIKDIVASVRAHPLAGRLLEPGSGKAEQSLFYTDPSTGIELRGRVDWLRTGKSGRLIIVDLKTGASANPRKFVNTAADYGYHMQRSWYQTAAKALGLDDDPAFLHVIVEVKPPYLVSVVELDGPSTRIGRGLNRAAIDLYAECVAADKWPGFTDDEPEIISLPGWYQNRFEEYL